MGIIMENIDGVLTCRCPKCNGYQVFIDREKKSAKPPMKNFVCSECGHKWEMDDSEYQDKDMRFSAISMEELRELYGWRFKEYPGGGSTREKIILAIREFDDKEK
jgi:hypothetical protein